MTNTREQKQAETDANYHAFQRLLPDLMKKSAGRYALLRHQEVVGTFDTARDALVHGTKTYTDSLFSVQEITMETVDMGWLSHAPHYAAL